MSNYKDYNGSQRPQESENNFSEKKGIGLFFGDAEAAFLDQVGREMVVNILQESFILYRIDLRRTNTHALYGESLIKEYKSPIEVFGRINVEEGSPEMRTQNGISKQGMGELNAGLYLSHLEDIGILEKDGSDVSIDMKKGDFLSHKGQFYEIWNDGHSQIGNQSSLAGDRRSFISIKAKEVDRDVFNGV